MYFVQAATNTIRTLYLYLWNECVRVRTRVYAARVRAPKEKRIISTNVSI